MIPCCTIAEELEVKERILDVARRNANVVDLDRELHVKFLTKSLKEPLPSGYQSLDSSRPWLFFWIVRSLTLLEKDYFVCEEELREMIIGELLNLEHAEGGFMGNTGQKAHLAATYAACACLTILSAIHKVNKENLYKFLKACKRRELSTFETQAEGGEDDLRALYCAVAVAHMARLDDMDLLFDSTFVERIKECQTYEGGLGAVPYAEAHGGYTFCGLAALALLGKAKELDLVKLLDFIKRLQCTETGGLRGRTNKLVDGCYSYWQGAAACIAGRSLGLEHDGLLDWPKLKAYITKCCQDCKHGGLRDKPGKPVDLYHTCYCLSGLRLCDGNQVSDDFLFLNT